MGLGVTEPFWVQTYDLYMIKTHPRGDLIWKRRVEVDGEFDMGTMLESKDGNYIIVGSVSNKLNTDSNIIVIKVDPDGKEIWSKQFGGEEKEHGRDIIDTGDGYLLLCKSETNARADTPKREGVLGMLQQDNGDNEDSGLASKTKELASGFAGKIKDIQGKIRSKLKRDKDEEEDDLDF